MLSLDEDIAVPDEDTVLVSSSGLFEIEKN